MADSNNNCNGNNQPSTPSQTEIRGMLLRRLTQQKIMYEEIRRHYIDAMRKVVEELDNIDLAMDQEMLVTAIPHGVGSRVKLTEEFLLVEEESKVICEADLVINTLTEEEVKSAQSDGSSPSTSGNTKKKRRRGGRRKTNRQKRLMMDLEKQNKLRTDINNAIESRRNVWIVDSGASTHMTFKKNWLSNFQEYEELSKLSIANGDIMIGHGRGDVRTRNTEEVIIRGVLYVPTMAVNLLSVSKLVQQSLIVVFSKDGCNIYQESDCTVTGRSLLACKEDHGVYILEPNQFLKE